VTAPRTSLERFESLVYSRRREEAARYLLSLLDELSHGFEFRSFEGHVPAHGAGYSRLAAAIGALFVDPAFAISPQGFLLLATHHRTLDAVFQASVFGNSDHLVRSLGAVDPDGRALVLDRAQAAKLLLLHSLDSDLDLPLAQVREVAPDLAAPFFLSLLSEFVILSEAAYRRREALLGMGDVLEDAEPSLPLVRSAAEAYAHCSYATSANKHDIKKALNSLMQRFVQSRSTLPAMPPQRQVRPRPTMLVALEWFSSSHAMYRCYATLLRGLRAQFRLVAAVRSCAIDTVARSLFDEVIEFPPVVDLGEAVRRISAVAPDLLYYPSVGLEPWCAALASVRLAPVQFCTLGHPATTNSEAMDYVLLSDACPGTPGRFSETVVLVSGLPPMLSYPEAQFPARKARVSPATLRVAVSAMMAKISVPFLRACSRIASRAAQPLEFHFFTMPHGVNWFRAQRMLGKWFPSATVHRPMPYNDYLRRFGECDVHLSTFPFGGTNTNIDSMKLGLPIVTLEGSEVHGQSDAAMMRAAGLPEWLIARSVGEYEEAALKLVSEQRTRSAIAEQLLGTDIDAALGERRDSGSVEDFCSAVAWLYAGHESIQATGRRYWTVEARRAHAQAAAQGSGMQAAQALRRGIEIRPAQQSLGRQDEALLSHSQAVLLAPGHAQAHFNLGATLYALGRLDEAEGSYRCALGLEPDYAEAYNNLGVTLFQLARLTEAEESLRKAIALRQDASGAHANLALVFARQGRQEESVAMNRAALSLDPGNAVIHANLIFSLDFVEHASMKEQQEERHRWYERHGRGLAAAIRPHENLPEPARRLRIGYVSADFRRHSAYNVFGPVIRRHDRRAFEVVCYSAGTREDDCTRALREAVDLWRPIATLPDEAVAQQVSADAIDILVDLSGHSHGNRLPVFARKPAPVQVTAWGYAAGTGVETIDYFLADPVLVAPEERVHFAEEIVDLPCALCYEAPEYMPAPSPSPELQRDPFTFACINRVQKISDRIVGVWSRILEAVPGSRLLIKDQQLNGHDARQYLLGRLRKAEIPEERVELLGESSHLEHLKIFDRVHLALDPYPHVGGISTLEALWMGVPVVTMTGGGTTSRSSASILAAAGMEEWIARSDDEYVGIARNAARKRGPLIQARGTLRERMLSSPVGDCDRYTREVERAYRRMWRRWCKRRPQTAAS
jgi:protein O-GlcNAc transferase